MSDPIPPEALLAGFPPPMGDLAERLRVIVRSAVPELIERVRVGWRLIGYDVPVGRRSAYFAWILPEATHVHLGFPRGVLLDDESGVLLGRGITKQARWFTLRGPGDVAEERFTAFVRSAADAAGLAGSPRAARRDGEASTRG